MNFELDEDILFLKKNVRDLIQTLEFLQSHELVQSSLKIDRF